MAGQRAGWRPKTATNGRASLSATRYNSAVMIERDPQAWVLKALREAGSSLISELYDVDEESLVWRPAEGEWSLKEIAAHLRDAEELALAQFNAFVAGSSSALPTGQAGLPAWDVDLLPQERDYQSEEIARVLASFRGLRRETTYLLWALTEADWQRSAEHPYRGPVTLGELARELAQHDLEHLWQVRQIKERLREAVPAREEAPSRKDVGEGL